MHGSGGFDRSALSMAGSFECLKGVAHQLHADDPIHNALKGGGVGIASVTCVGRRADRLNAISGSCFSSRKNVGTILTKDDLRYVGGAVHSHPRRIRALIEKGWQIESSNVRPGLGSGDYVIVAVRELPAKARTHIKQRHRILETARYTCRNCGRSPNQTSFGLQIHHSVVPVPAGGGNHDKNLVVLCVDCHAGVHATDTRAVQDELLNPGVESLYQVMQRRTPAREIRQSGRLRTAATA